MLVIIIKLISTGSSGFYRKLCMARDVAASRMLGLREETKMTEGLESG